MGAETFWMRASGKTAKDAFASARSQAQWDHGHSGYTGTIAEKQDFVVIKIPEVDALPKSSGPDDINMIERSQAAHKAAEALIDARDSRVDDKWGPAGCIEIGGGEFLFFGWASS
jgi:hypothetical protein